ncbi:MAG: DUF2157 domain-containing protein [Bryobacterales bacterium]|nr:DUF2157 domain-containing protein [Bryobacterales bacterium]
MAAPWEKAIERWREAGLLDSLAVERIREYEASRATTPRLRWTSILALSFGGLLLSAGILLFVAAHWDEMTPFARMALIIVIVGAFHAGGAAVRFPALASTLHAVGTVVLGGAIAMAGQVFHMQEHWPSAVLLWALGAWAGVWLLRDWPQITLAALLTPAWVYSEVGVRSGHGAFESATSFFFLTAIVYMAAPGTGNPPGWRRALAVIGMISVIPAAASLLSMYGPAKIVWGYPALLAIVPCLLAVWLRGKQAVMLIPWLLWCGMVMFVCNQKVEILIYALYAIGSIVMIRWGMVEARAERVNLGIAGFAITVIAFYFSNVMSALDRSLSLILLGVLFLAGGWQLERLRRRLLSQIREAGA